jgi:CubicO group peptidase (beta-lactamase class C family)
VKVGTINPLFALTLVSAAVLVFPADHSGPRNRESQAANNAEQRIRRVELGLVAVDRVKGETPTPKSPIERMHHHKIPGVSIGVINNEKIDWSRGYGLADSDRSDGRN